DILAHGIPQPQVQRRALFVQRTRASFLARLSRLATRATEPLLFFALPTISATLGTASSRGFSADSMAYVDAARHIVRAQGISQNILFIPSMPTLPTPFVQFAPLYSITVAAVSALGPSLPIAARLVSLLAFGLSGVVIW